MVTHIYVHGAEGLENQDRSGGESGSSPQFITHLFSAFGLAAGIWDVDFEMILST